jgi:hypothetical protein
MATREELEHERQALQDAAARLVALAEHGLDGRPTEEDLAHAQAYEESAALMRRRAARFEAQGDVEHAAYERTRAEHFKARAVVKRAGDPMPRALRTPAESLVRIDEFRRALGGLLTAFADIDAEEWSAFVEALVEGDEASPDAGHLSRDESFASLERVLEALGVQGTDERVFRAFASPLNPLGRSG